MDNLRLTERGMKFIQYFMGRVKDSNIYRFHHISLTLFLSKVPKDLEKNKCFQPFSSKRYKGLRTELLGTKFLYYGKDRANLYMPDIFADTKEEILEILQSRIHEILEILNIEFHIEADGFEVWKLNTGHISLIGQLQKVRGYFKDGNFAIDCSHNKPEIEAENVDTLFDDIDKLRNFKGGINFGRNIDTTQKKISSACLSMSMHHTTYEVDIPK